MIMLFKSRYLIILVILPLVYTCEFPGNSFKHVKFKLSNNIGIVSMAVPIGLDTFYKWMYVSDCSPCCHEQWYRFANKNYSLLEESESFYPQIPDSIFQLTLSHKSHQGCSKKLEINQISVDSIVVKRQAAYYDSYQGKEKLSWRFRKTETINGRKFILLGYEGKSEYSNLGQKTMIEGITVKNGETILLKYECSGQLCEGFYEKALKSLRSVQFK